MAGRHVDERVALRAPGIYRRLIELVVALPPGSVLRRRIVKRVVARGFEAFSREDDEVVLLNCDPGVEITVVGARMIGLAERYYGHQGCRDWWRQWRAEWASARYAPEAVIDLGDRLVVRVTMTARGASSAAEVAHTTGYVYYLGDRGVERQDLYWDWSECAEALRLDGRAAPAASIGA